jgi:hypothetical protein
MDVVRGQEHLQSLIDNNMTKLGRPSTLNSKTPGLPLIGIDGIAAGAALSEP